MKKAIYDKNTKTVQYVDMTNEEVEIMQNNIITYQRANEIAELKQNLADTDYQAIKYAEGQITEEEYLSIKTQRQEWRDRINELESEV